MGTQSSEKKKNKRKSSKKYRDAFITQDYARAVQKERKKLVKAIFIARGKGHSAKVVNRNLIVDNVVYNVDTIPENLRSENND